jgi:hypothetical protein
MMEQNVEGMFLNIQNCKQKTIMLQEKKCKSISKNCIFKESMERAQNINASCWAFYCVTDGKYVEREVFKLCNAYYFTLVL